MKMNYVENYEIMSRKGAQLMIDLILKKADANICLATGGSPKRMYEIFVEEVKRQGIDVSNVFFTKLDDWCGLSKDDEETCEYFIQKYILEPLAIHQKQVISFNLAEADYEAEARRIQRELAKRPLDLCILGLGMNGHLGLNEPADYLLPYAHVTPLDEKTKTHSMLRGKKVKYGITLGMGELMRASQILMLISGEKKEKAYESLMSQEVTSQVPASFLWLHSNCVMLIDQEYFPGTRKSYTLVIE